MAQKSIVSPGSTSQSPQMEPMNTHHHRLLCWKSVFAGVLISIMSYMILTSLGAGIGGLTASSLINNDEGGAGLATGAGLWLGLSAVISLFLGSYFSLRISNFVTNKVGAAHGFVIASVFFILLMWAAGTGLGNLSRGIGRMAGAMGQATSNLAMNPSVQDTVHKALGNGQLKSDPTDVAQGLAVRLLQGDTESAKTYYAYQTGMTDAEADAKFNQMKADFDQKVKVAAEKTASAVADAGWSLFVTFLVGLLSAVIGGRVGAQANNERPMMVKETVGYRRELSADL